MYGPPEAAATSIHCRMLDQFFDCLNVRNTKETAIKGKTFLKPYILWPYITNATDISDK